MRIIIIASIIGLCAWFGWKSFSNILHPEQKAKTEQAATVESSKEPPVVPVPVAAVVQDPVAGVEPINPPVQVETVGAYLFRNRPVPEPPFGRGQSSIGTGPDARGLELSLDPGANAWIMRGPPQEVEQVKRIAAFIDHAQTEIDLDFVLVAVSNDWLRRIGFAASYQNGASWIDAFSLGAEGPTLRIASGDFVLNVDAEAANNSARLVSAPVVRCITGEPWEFAADQQVPVASLTRSEGVVSTGYEYQRVGLGFQGVLYKAGPESSFRLSIDQRNGSVEGSGEASEIPPRLKEQSLKSSLVVELGRWSCIGGVTSWKTEKTKRLLGYSESEEQELLLVFVRARDGLRVPPRAWPVGDVPKHLEPWSVRPWELGEDEHPLLPSKGWEVEERELIESIQRRKIGPRSK